MNFIRKIHITLDGGPPDLTSADASCECARILTLKEKANFLTEYAAWLLGCGATCIRLEKNVNRIADAFGLHVETTIMPRHIHMSFYDEKDDVWLSTVTAPRRTPISFSVNTRLSQLSWQIADGEIPPHDARDALQAAVTPDRRSRSLLILMVGLANASFCRLFGGDFAAMGIVAVATIAGFWLKGEMLRKSMDIRLIMFLCAFFSSLIGASGLIWPLSATPTVALATSVLYLVPGIPFLNSFSDMLYRHYVCALSRLMDAVVLTCCLSAGMCAGMWLMHASMF